ncbi:6631_t:CDS:2 [Diversispora eburnea]|uniref:6631_t:CDS:1 n=1 Tax=Diversispora eburnea TaxID=1213867 RepID=A0A9N9AHY5_9GLOM|nr:6631_t:CDS:2 [Diversispora eburnea]
MVSPDEKPDEKSFLPPPASSASAYAHRQKNNSVIRIFSVVAFYWIASLAVVFLNKFILSTSEYKFPFPLFVTWFQLIVALVILMICGTLGQSFKTFSVIPPYECEMNIARKIAPLTFMYVMMLTFNNMCLQYVEVARSLSIIFNIIFTYTLLGGKTSFPALACCSVVFMGFVIGSYGEINFSWEGIIYGVASSVFVALYGIYVKKTLIYVENDQWRLLHYNTTLSVFLLFPLVLFSGELQDIVNVHFLGETNFWILMIFTGITGFIINIAMFMQIKVTTPLTNTISGTAKACFQTALAAWYFQNEISTMEEIISQRTIEVMSILTNSSQNFVTENSGLRTFDKVMFNPSSTLDNNRKRYICSNSQAMPTTTTTTTSSTTTPTLGSMSASKYTESVPSFSIKSMNQNQNHLSHNDNENNTKDVKDVKGDLSLLLVKKVQPPTPPRITTSVNEDSDVIVTKKTQHQRVASDDDALGTLPSPATSVLDFPGTNNSINSIHHIKNTIPSFKRKFVSKESNLGLKNSLSTLEMIGQYAVLKTIGSGAFSEVKLAVNLNTGEKVAIKMISTKGIHDSDRLKTGVWREVELLKFIEHPNIVKLIDTIETPKHLCLILEYVPGGELFDFINDHFDKLTEDIAKDIFLQLVNVINYLHDVNIVHRDLKLENILLEIPYPSFNSSSPSSNSSSNSSSLSNSWKPIVKLTDFGLAKFLDKNSPFSTTRCGSEEYAAPELIQVQPYDGRKTDIWSLGIILYTLLMGYLPFNQERGQSRKQFLSKIVRADFNFPKSSDVSEEAKDLVKKILVSLPSKRPNLDEIRKHPWLNSVHFELDNNE